jgi:hypothetical protein
MIMLWLWFFLPFVNAPYVEKEQSYTLVPTEIRKPTRIRKIVQRIHAPRRSGMLKMNLLNCITT